MRFKNICMLLLIGESKVALKELSLLTINLLLLTSPLFFTCLGGLKAFSLLFYDEDDVAFHNPK